MDDTAPNDLTLGDIVVDNAVRFGDVLDRAGRLVSAMAAAGVRARTASPC